MVKKKRQSKRQTLKMKFKVERKVVEAHRKARRASKKQPGGGSKLRKDPGIPNLHPFKAQLWTKIEEQQRKLKQQQVVSSRRANAFAQKRKLAMSSSEQMAALAGSASARAAAFERDQEKKEAERVAREAAPPLERKAVKSNQSAYFRHLRKVVEKSDVLLEVLDARDPMGCRVPAMESLVMAKEGKRIILVLNKIDLVPPAVVREWLSVLRREFPTIAFKASTQSQQKNLHAPSGSRVGRATRAGEAITGSGAAGSETLLQLIKNYSRNHKLKTAVTVGVIGFPNVGKSSLINSLKRSKSASVSSKPGHTKAMQEIHLDSKVTLLDCPGVILEDQSRAHSSSLLLRNVISVDEMEAPEMAIAAILSRCSPARIMEHFGIPAYHTVDKFLFNVAEKRCRLLKGGVPDRQAAARSVLMEWNTGKIPFFTQPPPKASLAEPATVVQDWAKEFNVDDVLATEEREVLAPLPAAEPTEFMPLVYEPSGAQGRRSAAGIVSLSADIDVSDEGDSDFESGEGDEDEDDDDDVEYDDDEEDEDEDEEGEGVGAPEFMLAPSTRGAAAAKPVRDVFTKSERAKGLAPPVGTRKQQRAAKKKEERASRRKGVTSAGAGAGVDDDDMGDDDKYDFSRDFVY